MAQTYEIYLRNKTGDGGKPTQPRQGGSSNTTPKSNDGEKKEAAEEGLMQAATKSKAGKVMLAIYAAGKIAKETVGAAIPFITRETGDFRFATAWQNTWQTINNLLNPIGAAGRQINYYHENMIINQRQEQQRLLVGDSYINNMSRKV